MSLKYKDLQPWVEMLCEALENRGASSSGIPDVDVYPYAEKYREVLKKVREKDISLYDLDIFLTKSYDEIMSLTTQPYRISCLLNAIKVYFYKEYAK